MRSAKQAKQMVEALPKDARIIELAGPTPGGNEYLQRNKIRLSAKPLITNQQNPALFYGLPPYPKKIAVDEIANVHQLLYRDVDMFLCSYLPWYNDHRFTSRQLPKRFLAKLHYMVRYTKSHTNPRISLFRETAKALRPGGLLLVEGLRSEDYPIAAKCGFKVIHADDDAALFQIT